MNDNDKNKIERQRTAYHEAGHAVAAVALGRGVKRVSITPDGEGAFGHVLLGELDNLKDAIKAEDKSDKTRRAVEREVLIALAGPAAEFIHDPNADDGGHQDREVALRLLRGLSHGAENEAVAYADWLGARTGNLLRLHWGAVEALAQALLLMGEVSGSAARKLATERLYEGKAEEPAEDHDRPKT